MLYSVDPPELCPEERYIVYQNYEVPEVDGVLDLIEEEVPDGGTCYSRCYVRPHCRFFQVTDSGYCVMFNVEFDEALLLESSTAFVGLPCSQRFLETRENSTEPPIGPTEAPVEPPTEPPPPDECPEERYVTYLNYSVPKSNLFLTYLEDRNADDCFSHCFVRPDCGFFQVTTAGLCVMFTNHFDVSFLERNSGYIVGVPCSALFFEYHNFTEPPTKAPTEPPPPKLCPEERYIVYQNYEVPEIGVLDLIEDEVPDGGTCYSRCYVRPRCRFFQVTDSGYCLMFNVDFDEALLLESSTAFVGLPCSQRFRETRDNPTKPPIGPTEPPTELPPELCPEERYILYQNYEVPEVDGVLDLIEDEVPDGGTCYSRCYVRPRCRFFQVTDSGYCVMFNVAFDEALLLESTTAFVGLPCSQRFRETRDNPTEPPTEAPTEPPPPDECPEERYVTYQNYSAPKSDLFLTYLEDRNADDCFSHCFVRPDCGFFEVTTAGLCVMFANQFDVSFLERNSGNVVGVPCSATFFETRNFTEAPTERPPPLV